MSGRPNPSQTKDLTSWGHLWFLLLALRELERMPTMSKKEVKQLKATCPEQEWAIGSYLWIIWTNKMKEVHGEGHTMPHNLRQPLSQAMATPLDLCPIC